MKTLLQRVESARVLVDAEEVAAISAGLLLFVGVEDGDTQTDALVTARKLASLRVFRGRTPMDRDVREVGGACLVVSQFTLAGSLRKGRRPSFDAAMAPEQADKLYQLVATTLADEGIAVQTGRFGAHMHVELVNDGPVTLLLEVRDGQVR